MINKFSELVEALKVSTFEGIAVKYYQKKYNVHCEVECDEDEVYDDQDLTEFLDELGAEITEYNGDHVIIKTKEGEIYKVSSEDRENRFDSELPDETVLHFDTIEKGV